MTYQPHQLQAEDISSLRKHYSDLQILEMILSLAGNNAINRWKEGAGIPQSHDSSNFAKNAPKPLPKDRILPIETYLTPTSEKYLKAITQVTPLQPNASQRPPLESPDDLAKALANGAKRTPYLPLIDEASARSLLQGKETISQWERLLLNFPNHGMVRLESHRQTEEKGNLSPLLKAQLSWIIARQDRAWYALAEAGYRLRKLGCSTAQIQRLDGDWNDFTAMERAQFTLARNLAASPISLSDAEVATALRLTSNQQVVQLIHYTTMRVSFNRITEAAGLNGSEWMK